MADVGLVPEEETGVEMDFFSTVFEVFTVDVAFGVDVIGMSFFTAFGKGFFVPRGVRGFGAALIRVLLAVTGVFFAGVEEVAGLEAEVPDTGRLVVAEVVDTGLAGAEVFSAVALDVDGSALLSFLGFLLTG